MKLLIISEGKHELGSDSEAGALVELLRRLRPKEFEYEQRKVSDSSVQQVAMHGRSVATYEKRVVMWIRYAERKGFDGMVLVVDEDGDTDRRAGIANAQTHDKLTLLPRAIGLAIRSFDTWMLADEKALSEVLGKTVNRSKDPENIRRPKNECRSILAEHDDSRSLTELYREVAKVANLDCLAERCPLGFSPFRTFVTTTLQKT